MTPRSTAVRTPFHRRGAEGAEGRREWEGSALCTSAALRALCASAVGRAGTGQHSFNGGLP
jgi:hypothetical protein